MSMYLFNIFNESAGNDHSATILTCLDTKLFSPKKPWFLKTINISSIPSNSLSLIFSDIFYK